MARLGSRRKAAMAAMIVLATTLLLSSAISLITQPIQPAQAQQGQQLSPEERNWPKKNGNYQATNYSPQKQLGKDNIQFLEMKWIYPVPDSARARALLTGVTFGVGTSEGSETPPLIVDGIAYVMTNYRQISAIDAEDGKTIWVFMLQDNYTKYTDPKGLNLPISGAASLHTHGISYWDGKIWFHSWGCMVNAVDALTGKLVWQVGPICKDIPGNKNDPVEKHPKGEGIYKNDCTSSTVNFYPPKRLVLANCAGQSEGTGGGRAFVAAYNADTKQLAWRVYYTPPRYPPDPDWALRECSKGWFVGAEFKEMASGKFSSGAMGWENVTREKKNVYTTKAWSCEEVRQKCPECLKDDWIHGKDYQTGSPWQGKFAGGSGVSNTWGDYAIDVESETIFFATAQPGPDYNMTFRPGPNLYSNTVFAVNANDGSIKWWVQIWPHDGIDVDCNLNTVFGKAGNQKVVLKTCKSGISAGMDANTGKVLWVYDPFSLPDGLVKRPENHACSAPINPTNLALLTCLNQFCDPVLGSYADRKANCRNYGHHDRYMMESDMAFDGKYFYSSVMSGANYIMRITPLTGNPPGGVLGGSGSMFPVNWDVLTQQKGFEMNSTLTKIDAVTGQVVWRWFRDFPHRGGVVVSNGVVYINDGRGWLSMLDADTGKEIARKNIGFPLTSQITMGAGNDGKIKVYIVFGGGQHGVWGAGGVVGGTQIPGAVIAYGLPDTIPERVVTKEVVKEVPKEVIKEVPKEITKTVTVETVSPITYAIVGIAIVIAVVGVVAGQRRRRAA